MCKQLLKGGTKTCEPASSCPASKLAPVVKKGPKKYGELSSPTKKLCKDEQFCDSTNKCQMDTEDSCGTNNDCAQLNIEKRFCLNAGLVKHCVPKSPCKAPCTDLQICDKREMTCKDPSKTRICCIGLRYIDVSELLSKSFRASNLKCCDIYPGIFNH